MQRTPTASRTATGLAVATGAAGVVGGVWTIADPGLLHGAAAMEGSARGTAVVLVCVAVPWLALAPVWRAHRGSSRALLLWAASLLFIIYSSVLFLFLTPFNAAFLVYVAMLGSAL